ncbi:DNA polymerase III subunit beta [Conexibacter sp. DBS9H8]|uniref:DNA polymerase III subunit beta n=1 Tax=Conexibacter sp. DBS9H8 TaxID=2937801 RepID=UPI00200DE065|nr:DNA polymerase III subunit beta [Conexibacter sp. DBS9H8]
MKISLDRELFLSHLQTVARVASTRSAISALSGVQLLAESGRCELRATDTDVSLRVPLPAEVSREGMAVLPARLLLDVVRSLPAATVGLEVRPAEQDVELVSGNATFHIRTLHAEDFPPFPEPDPAATVLLSAAAFVETATRVAGSASRDETRPVLTGIHVIAEGSELRMVATDSYRLSVKETTLPASLSAGFEVNVPARALQELTRIVGRPEGEVELAISVRQNQVVFRFGDIVLSSRLIDGQFPNDRQLIPETFEHQVRVAAAELRDVVRRISLLAQKNAPLRLAFSPGELIVSAQTPDIGEASEALPVPFQGDGFEIGFNPEFLRDGLEAIADGDVLLRLISPLRPGLLESTDDARFRYLIMPIRLNV